MKTVAIIGAGASGLTAIKCCLDEGLEPTCFERTSNIGGLWYYTDDVRDGQACVMQSTTINTSKEMMCYSDFPIPKEFPIFLPHSYVLRYFLMYANEFGLKEHIEFNTEILTVKPKNGMTDSTQWLIEVKNKTTGITETRVFDAVMVCTGHHADKKMPNFPGQESFKGKLTHSHDYRNWKGYEGKRVVVVGIGNSGGDAAVEISRFASKLYLSTRRGSWVFNRVGDNGLPWDMLFSKRSNTWLQSFSSQQAIQEKTEKLLNKRLDHTLYSLKPNHGPFQQHPTVNDDLPNRIISGSVTVKPNIRRFTETGVEFEDRTSDEVDCVVFATGYVFGFPFIDQSIIEVNDNRVNLYKLMFPPDIDRPTIAIIGCFQPVGALMPISELQCRLATRVFKRSVTLPSKKQRWDDISNRAAEMKRRYVESSRHTIQVDYVGYLDELAILNGCKPNFTSLFFTDPRLAVECFFGPCTPYQYRLQGPGKWAGAREAIMTQWERTYYPLKTRPLAVQENQKRRNIPFMKIMLVAGLVYFIRNKETLLERGTNMCSQIVEMANSLNN